MGSLRRVRVSGERGNDRENERDSEKEGEAEREREREREKDRKKQRERERATGRERARARDNIDGSQPLCGGSHAMHFTPISRSRANSAHIRQSRPDVGLGYQVKAFKIFQSVPSSISSGAWQRVLRR